jgi:hypothetical protein
MAYGTVVADVIGTSVAGSNLGAGNASIMKNRIINGAMVIDQRNAGASVAATTDGQYTLDRWTLAISQASKYNVQQNAGSVATPVGFSNYLGITSSSAYSVLTGDYFALQQKIEGFNFSDLNWGTANAKTVTLSFQVYSSLTGTFGGSLGNSALNRSYPFTYSIPVANTWTTISVTIAGDTTGTWVGATNGIGLRVFFGLGCGATYNGTAGSWAGSLYFSATGATSVVGTSGATFYITGVQLEVGSSATGFEYRQYQQELALCQRYFEKSYNQDVAIGALTASGAFIFQTTNLTSGTPTLANTMPFAVVKRAAVTPTFYSPSTGASGKARDFATAADVNANANTTGTQSFSWYVTTGATQTQVNFGVQWTVSAEL